MWQVISNPSSRAAILNEQLTTYHLELTTSPLGIAIGT
jgi:hypothetical protein